MKLDRHRVFEEFRIVGLKEEESVPAWVLGMFRIGVVAT
jgi:hypothetical protein